MANTDDFESLKRAMAGSYAMLAVPQCIYPSYSHTPMHQHYHSHLTPYSLAKSIIASLGESRPCRRNHPRQSHADASVAAGVALLIWPSLLNIVKMTNGGLTHVPWFDSEADAKTYIRGLPITSSFMARYYMRNSKTRWEG